MPKFKAHYYFDKLYNYEGEKEVEAKDIKEAIEKLKKAGSKGHLMDDSYETGDKPSYTPWRMHVYNSEKFNEYSEAEETLGLSDSESADVASDLDFKFED